MPRHITTPGILKTLQLAYQAVRSFGIEHPRIAVAALNPHAGEGSLFGSEEQDIILPAVLKARAQGIDASDPLPADTIFLKVRNGNYDIVVAMYHDQGLAPLKMVAFDSAVNVTVGLPIIRTSVDHGTAFDIAGKGLRRPGKPFPGRQGGCGTGGVQEGPDRGGPVNRRASDHFLTRSHIFTIVFFVVFLFLLYQMVNLLRSVLGCPALGRRHCPCAPSRCTAGSNGLFRGRQALAALTMTLLALLMIIGPAISLLAVLVSQTVELYQWAAEGIRTGTAQELWNRTSSLLSQKLLDQPLLAGLDIRGMLVKALSQLSSSLASQVGPVLRDALLLVVDVFIMLIALYFFFRNGERYYAMTLDLIPFSREQKESIAQKLYDTFTAVINGVFLIALGQGIMTGIGFAVFHVPFPVFWGFLAAVLALLPVGGSALVWVPGAMFLLITRSTLSGVLLAAWGTFLVSLPDNFIKPLIIGKKAKLPTFFLFLGILGGLQIYGFLGILFGPLVVTLVTAFIQIYREEFAGNDHSR